MTLASQIRERLGPPPEHERWPSVSIVVLNRDGLEHLRRLLAGLAERTEYPGLELIVVDNGSSDGSLELLGSAALPFPLEIVANERNESFSDANNQGARLAAGELLLFLNNDTEPFERGWLRELVACLEASPAGAAGPVLLEPSGGEGARCGHAVQQRGLAAREVGGEGTLGAALRYRGADPLEVLGEDTTPLAVAAACLLIRREDFEAVGGFTPGYMYGPEDVDLALKLREAGKGVVCCGRSFLIHPMNSTLDTVAAAERSEWVRSNRRLFLERWGPRIRREFELDRLAGGGLWAEPGDVRPGDGERGRRELEALGYCLLAGEEGARAELAGLRDELRRRGVRCLALSGSEVNDLRALECDVAVHLGGSARAVLQPAQLNVLWCGGDADAVGPSERARYDLVFDGPAEPAELADDLLAAVARRARERGFETRIGSN